MTTRKPPEAARAKRQSKRADKTPAQSAASFEAPDWPEIRLPTTNTKLHAVVKLLGRKSGASIGALIKFTGWLPHTTRAALSRLRKRGYRIDCRRNKSGVSVYRLGGGAKLPGRKAGPSGAAT